MGVIATQVIWAIPVESLSVQVIVHSMAYVWLLRSVVVLGGRWEQIVRWIVDVGGMVRAIPTVLVFVILVLPSILHPKKVSMNV